MVELGRLETCEMAAFADFQQAAPTALARRAGIAVHRLQSGVALVASVADVLALNRVLGVGLNGGLKVVVVR